MKKILFGLAVLQVGTSMIYAAGGLLGVVVMV